MSTVNHAFVNEDANQSASKGMRVQGVTTLNPGMVLFRFVQRSDVPLAEYLCSPWYFQGSVVRSVLNAARSGHRGETSAKVQAARKAGLSTTWAGSGANYLLSAKVIAPISALWGSPLVIGKKKGGTLVSGLAGGDADEIEVVPDASCVQLFVPGMWEERIRLRAMTVVSRTKFKNNPNLIDGDIEGFIRGASGR